MKPRVVPTYDEYTGEVKLQKKDCGFVKVDIKAIAEHQFTLATTAVLYFFILKMSKRNKINATRAAIIEGTGICRDTANAAISQLKQVNFLKQLGRSKYMFNPDIACRVSTDTHEKLREEYQLSSASTNKTNKEV